MKRPCFRVLISRIDVFCPFAITTPGMRVEFVPEDRITVRPTIEIRDVDE